MKNASIIGGAPTQYYGGGGQGYGAGGGGGGFQMAAPTPRYPGGNGAKGFVYIEWK